MADNSMTSLEKSTTSGFQSRFLMVLATILLLFSGFAASIIYHHEKENLEENAFEKTDLIMKAIESNRDYIQDVLRPAMYKELGEDQIYPRGHVLILYQQDDHGTLQQKSPGIYLSPGGSECQKSGV